MLSVVLEPTVRNNSRVDQTKIAGWLLQSNGSKLPRHGYCWAVAAPEIVGVQVISLDDAPKGHGEFDAGVSKKFVIDHISCLVRRKAGS